MGICKYVRHVLFILLLEGTSRFGIAKTGVLLRLQPGLKGYLGMDIQHIRPTTRERPSIPCFETTPSPNITRLRQHRLVRLSPEPAQRSFETRFWTAIPCSL